MNTSFRRHLLLGCLVSTVAACAATVDSAAPEPAQTPLLGRYATKNGGQLEIFEVERGSFLIGELVPAAADPRFEDQSHFQSAPIGSSSQPSLLDVYAELVGGTPPAALVAAQGRASESQLGEAQEAPSAASTPADPGQQEPASASGETVNKEVDRDLAGFRANECREANRTPQAGMGCQSVSYCWTERKGDATLHAQGLYGSVSAVKSYRGGLTFDVFYNSKMKNSRTLAEGELYRTWAWADQTTNKPSYNLELQVRGADSSGFHLAMVGTQSAQYWKEYDVSNAEACTRAPSRVPLGRFPQGPAEAGP